MVTFTPSGLAPVGTRPNPTQGPVPISLSNPEPGQPQPQLTTKGGPASSVPLPGGAPGSPSIAEQLTQQALQAQGNQFNPIPLMVQAGLISSQEAQQLQGQPLAGGATPVGVGRPQNAPIPTPQPLPPPSGTPDNPPRPPADPAPTPDLPPIQPPDVPPANPPPAGGGGGGTPQPPIPQLPTPPGGLVQPGGPGGLVGGAVAPQGLPAAPAGGFPALPPPNLGLPTPTSPTQPAGATPVPSAGEIAQAFTPEELATLNPDRVREFIQRGDIASLQRTMATPGGRELIEQAFPQAAQIPGFFDLLQRNPDALGGESVISSIFSNDQTLGQLQQLQSVFPDLQFQFDPQAFADSGDRGNFANFASGIFSNDPFGLPGKPTAFGQALNQQLASAEQRNRDIALGQNSLINSLNTLATNPGLGLAAGASQFLSQNPFTTSSDALQTEVEDSLKRRFATASQGQLSALSDASASRGLRGGESDLIRSGAQFGQRAALADTLADARIGQSQRRAQDLQAAGNLGAITNQAFIGGVQQPSQALAQFQQQISRPEQQALINQLLGIGQLQVGEALAQDTGSDLGAILGGLGGVASAVSGFGLGLGPLGAGLIGG